MLTETMEASPGCFFLGAGSCFIDTEGGGVLLYEERGGREGSEG